MKTSSRKPREKRTASASYKAVHERIREAEKKTSPVGVERVGVDEESYEMLAVLIERGLGRKHDVLRKALALGILTLRNTTAPIDAEDEEQVHEKDHFPELFPAHLEYSKYNTQATAAPQDEPVPIGPPIVTPPSEERRQQGSES